MRIHIDGPVSLRPVEAGDAAQRLAIGNHPDIHRMFGGDAGAFRELTPEAAEAWAKSLASEKYGWVITFKDALVGSVRIFNVNPVDRRGSMAIGILDPEALGKGVGTRAMRLVATEAFGPMKLNRLHVRVLAFNTPAIAAYKKVGFQVEGQERESAWIDGKWHDDLLMGLLARDFESLSP